MDNKKILWLCSWYPSCEEPFNGDFVQRHAKAASIYNIIHVIHVTNDIQGKLEDYTDEITIDGNLTEQIVYFKRSKTLASKVIDHLKWLAVYKRAIRNYIIKNGKPDLVHVHIPMKAGILAMWIRQNYKVPYVVTEHWGIYNSIIDNGYESKNIFFKKYTEEIFKKALMFLSVSNYLAEGVKRLVGLNSYTVIPNVVNTDAFCYCKKVNTEFRFIHVSNMVPLKNVEGILRSFKNFLEQNGNVELVMIGDTNLSIRNYANSLGIPTSTISFLGEIPYEKVATEMKKADCLILFSDIENSPCVIGEALCCGLPVIASDIGGIPELVDASNALLIKPKDEDALIKSMFTMSGDIARFDRKKIAENARHKFSYFAIGKEINSIYSEVIKK